MRLTKGRRGEGDKEVYDDDDDDDDDKDADDYDADER